MARRELPPDTIAYRRTLVAGAAAFVGGFALVAAGLVIVVVRYVRPTGHWSAIVDCILYALILPFVGGCTAAAGVMNALDRWYYWRGVHKCVYCGRPRRYGARSCVCWAEPGHPMGEHYARMQREHHPPRLRHHRKRLRPVLASYLALVPVALVAATIVPRPRLRPFFQDVIEAHFILCAAIGVTIAGVNSTLEVLKRGRRFRMRAEAFVRVFALWPVLAAFAWAGIALLRQ
jgi:hypothetical protein